VETLVSCRHRARQGQHIAVGMCPKVGTRHDCSEISDQLLCCQTRPASTQAGGGIAAEEHIPALLSSSPCGSNLASRMRLCRAFDLAERKRVGDTMSVMTLRFVHELA
jgi:hypothetical protein